MEYSKLLKQIRETLLLPQKFKDQYAFLSIEALDCLKFEKEEIING